MTAASEVLGALARAAQQGIKPVGWKVGSAVRQLWFEHGIVLASISQPIRPGTASTDVMSTGFRNDVFQMGGLPAEVDRVLVPNGVALVGEDGHARFAFYMPTVEEARRTQ